jgi:hypothetical protein
MYTIKWVPEDPVQNLLAELRALEQTDPAAYERLDFTTVPTAPIPADMDRDSPIWAMDISGNASSAKTPRRSSRSIRSAPGPPPHRRGKGKRMCGRFTYGNGLALAGWFAVSTWPEALPQHNVAPTQAVPTVLWNRETAARAVR